MNKETITILILSIVLLGIIFFVIKSFNDPLTPQIYLVNTYLYIYGGLIIIILFSAILGKFNIFQTLNPIMLFITFILSIISMFGILYTSTNNQLIKHFFFILFLFSISISTCQLYKIALNNNTLYSVLITLGIIIISLTILAYTQSPDTFSSWGPYLMIGLCGLIVFQVLDMIFGTTEGLMARDKIYGWITVIIFSGFILYNTQIIRQDAIIVSNSCPSKNQLACADYPSESLSMILNFINLFAGLVRAI